MNVLILSHFFAPYSQVAAKRMTALAIYLAEQNNNVFVIKANNKEYGKDVIETPQKLNLCDTCAVTESVWYGYVKYSSSAIHKYYGNREEMTISWLDTVIHENNDFFSKHRSVEGQLLLNEYNNIIHFDIMPLHDKCSIREINQTIRNMLGRAPWNKLKLDDYRKSLTCSQKAWLFMCRISFGGTLALLYIKYKSLFSIFLT